MCQGKWRLVLSAWAITVAASVAGCTTAVIAPEVSEHSEFVFLLDLGRHSSLVLPRADGSMVRYSFGDWDYYALIRTGPTETTSAALWPTQGTLGRKELPGPPTPEMVDTQVRVGIEVMYPIQVERGRIQRLLQRLDGSYAANIDTQIYNSAYDLYFVHSPLRYHLFRNSNHVVAQWLTDLGCEVRGTAFYSTWRVKEP